MAALTSQFTPGLFPVGLENATKEEIIARILTVVGRLGVVRTDDPLSYDELVLLLLTDYVSLVVS